MRSVLLFAFLFGFSAPTLTSDPVPADEAPYAAKRGIQIAADPAASPTSLIVGSWTAPFGSGGYGTFTFTGRKSDGTLLGRFHGRNASGPFDNTLASAPGPNVVWARVDADGANFRFVGPSGDMTGWITGGKLVTSFIAKVPNLRSGPITFTKQ